MSVFGWKNMTQLSFNLCGLRGFRKVRSELLLSKFIKILSNKRHNHILLGNSWIWKAFGLSSVVIENLMKNEKQNYVWRYFYLLLSKSFNMATRRYSTFKTTMAKTFMLFLKIKLYGSMMVRVQYIDWNFGNLIWQIFNFELCQTWCYVASIMFTHVWKNLWYFYLIILHLISIPDISTFIHFNRFLRVKITRLIFKEFKSLLTTLTSSH